MERMDCFISFTLEVDDKVGQYQVFFYAMWNVHRIKRNFKAFVFYYFLQRGVEFPVLVHL